MEEEKAQIPLGRGFWGLVWDLWEKPKRTMNQHDSFNKGNLRDWGRASLSWGVECQAAPALGEEP
jgi:hypothetical protein